MMFCLPCIEIWRCTEFATCSLDSAAFRCTGRVLDQSQSAHELASSTYQRLLQLLLRRDGRGRLAVRPRNDGLIVQCERAQQHTGLRQGSLLVLGLADIEDERIERKSRNSLFLLEDLERGLVAVVFEVLHDAEHGAVLQRGAHVLCEQGSNALP